MAEKTINVEIKVYYLGNVGERSHFQEWRILERRMETSSWNFRGNTLLKIKAVERICS
jgi:hypothetical protein